MNILKKTQNALAAWLVGQDLGDIPAANVYTGIDRPVPAEPDGEPTDGTKNLPSVVCQCSQAETKEHATGNYTARARVVIKASADDLTEDEFEEMSDIVCNFIETDTIHTDLSAAITDYTAHVVRVKAQSYDIVGRTWEHYLDLEIDCCGSDIS